MIKSNNSDIRRATQCLYLSLSKDGPGSSAARNAHDLIEADSAPAVSGGFRSLLGADVIECDGDRAAALEYHGVVVRAVVRAAFAVLASHDNEATRRNRA